MCVGEGEGEGEGDGAWVGEAAATTAGWAINIGMFCFVCYLTVEKKMGASLTNFKHPLKKYKI